MLTKVFSERKQELAPFHMRPVAVVSSFAPFLCISCPEELFQARRLESLPMLLKYPVLRTACGESRVREHTTKKNRSLRTRGDGGAPFFLLRIFRVCFD